MPQLDVTVPHSLGRDEAAVRVRSWFDSLATEHQGRFDELEVSWTDSGADFIARARGMKVSGHLLIRSDAVDVQAKLPLLAAAFKPQIAGFLADSLGRELV
jgi:hypothetical protein